MTTERSRRLRAEAERRSLDRLEAVAIHTVLVSKGVRNLDIARTLRVDEDLLKDWAKGQKCWAEAGVIGEGREQELHNLIAKLSRDFRDQRTPGGDPCYF